MIKAEKLSYSFPQKDLYNKISFTLEDDVHCAFIGTNGTGKSTLVDMILHPDNYLYDGRLIVDVPELRIWFSKLYLHQVGKWIITEKIHSIPTQASGNTGLSIQQKNALLFTITKKMQHQ